MTNSDSNIVNVRTHVFAIVHFFLNSNLDWMTNSDRKLILGLRYINAIRIICLLTRERHDILIKKQIPSCHINILYL